MVQFEGIAIIGHATLVEGRTKTICILVNEANENARAFYRKVGFKFTSTYDTIFLQQTMDA